MYRQSYFFGDFSTYTFKYVIETSHFANNLYFNHNERRFYFEFHSTQIEISIQLSLHDYESTFLFGSSAGSGMKDGTNSTWNEL